MVNSPSTLSQKYWITNGACHAKWAIVFAQTYVKDVHEGLHVFLVRIRNEDLSPCPGVFIEDMGMKIGSNGVDNARIAFNKVRIPRVNMLNKFADVDENGNFQCSIKKKRDRFLKVASRLLSGRICIASMSISPCKYGLYIAIKYSQKRLAVGKSGKSDTPIFAYQLQQNALVPILARTLALNHGLNYVRNCFADTSFDQDDLAKLCNVIKPLVGWNLEQVFRHCRERCGG